MTTIFDMMVGHVLIQRRWYQERARAVPWPAITAIAIHSRRSRFVDQATYIALARELEAAARARIKDEARAPRPLRRADRVALAQIEAERIRGTLRTEPALIRAAEAPRPAWQATARRAILESDGPISARTRVLGLRKPTPPPIAVNAVILRRAQYRELTPLDQIAEDVPMPPIDVPMRVEPIRARVDVDALAVALNGRRL